MSNFTVVDDFTHIIAGAKARSPTTVPVLNPATAQPFTHVPLATHAQLNAAVAAAEAAFPGWAATPWSTRQQALRSLADALDSHRDAFAALIAKEIGKDQGSAAFEVAISVPWLRTVAEQTLEDETVSKQPGKIATNRFRPYGVCAGIVPFNFPLTLTIIIKFSQAILAGNCLIVKTPPTAPCVVAKFIELAQSVLPPGVASVLLGGDELGRWVVRHPRILRVSFTGSTPAGKAVMAEAATELKALTLELGGNDPAIVLEDVDPAEVAQTIAQGALHNAGQTCFQIKRVYVHDAVYDAVKRELVSLVQTMLVGDPADPQVVVGPVQNEAQHARLTDLLADCKAHGYKIAFKSEVPTDTKGYFIPVVIFDDPPEDSRIVREEQFGPFIPLMRWKDEEDVLRRANGTEYGFGASVWGRDMARCKRMADGLLNGMVWVNTWGAVGGDMPMGGVKHSGIGTENSKHGLTAWTYVQSFVCVDPVGAKL
ncbi:aldehyde dehydrogenase [Epithele typhae]|uniref:aldehyde dehydrogenase n=1 Tax=Epithele typhae TaxID=378194 RepID=UPI002007511F|nr:aldehyde dehydrogenase [Epithele typhae]KAH9945466.1 aldehyde dehydrogenase [Epithele typhae]